MPVLSLDLFTFYKVERLRNSSGIGGEHGMDIIGLVDKTNHN